LNRISKFYEKSLKEFFKKLEDMIGKTISQELTEIDNSQFST